MYSNYVCNGISVTPKKNIPKSEGPENNVNLEQHVYGSKGLQETKPAGHKSHFSIENSTRVLATPPKNRRADKMINSDSEASHDRCHRTNFLSYTDHTNPIWLDSSYQVSYVIEEEGDSAEVNLPESMEERKK